jgi:ATP-dependent Zn protease
MGVSPRVRIALFGVMMIVLAFVVWQMGSVPKGQRSALAISYSDFMNQVDKNNVGSAKLLVSDSTAEIQGQLREPVQNFSVTIPKEVIPDLTDRLRKQGVVVDVAENRRGSPLNVFVGLLPLLLIVVIWIFRIQAMRARQRPPSGPPAKNQPLGD